MPEIPKLLADITARLIKKATIQSTEYFHPQLKRIVFQDDGLKNLNYAPGAQIEPRVSDTSFRHYSLSAFDNKKGVGEMLIYLHNNGPGCEWTNNLKPGDRMVFMGPANKIRLDITKPRIVLLGDETAMGTFWFMQNGMAANQQLTGAIEMESNLRDVTLRMGLNLDIVTRNSYTLLHWLQKNFSGNRNAQFYLLGNDDTNRRLRDFLRENNVSGSQITTMAYWKQGKRGL